MHTTTTIPIPRNILCRTDLPPHHRLVYFALVGRAAGADEVEVMAADLAQDAGVSVWCAHRATAALRRAGLIRQVRRGGVNRGSVYRLC